MFDSLFEGIYKATRVRVEMGMSQYISGMSLISPLFSEMHCNSRDCT